MSDSKGRLWPLKYLSQLPVDTKDLDAYVNIYHPRASEVLIHGEIDHRDELGLLLTHHGLIGEGVEVGVYKGQYSERLLSSWPGKMILVDPWCKIEDYDDDPVSLEDAEANYQLTVARLACYEHRYYILRYKSEDAYIRVADGSLVFAYIDAKHDRVSVGNDLRFWWPKLREGGLLCGHDIICKEWVAEVLPAVVDFALEKGIKIHLIPYPNGYWSYYMYKI